MKGRRTVIREFQKAVLDWANDAFCTDFCATMPKQSIERTDIHKLRFNSRFR